MPKRNSPYKSAFGSNSKYHNVKTMADGIEFDSKAEAKYYRKLVVQKAAGLIEDFSLQPKFELQEKFEKNGTKFRAITYKADFLVHHKDGRKEVIDIKSKGTLTKEFRIKQKLFEMHYWHLSLTIVDSSTLHDAIPKGDL